ESESIEPSRNGATEAEIDFLLDRRVELNAMTSDQLVAFVEGKLRRHGIGKIVPKKKELAQAYELFTRNREAEKIVSWELKKLNGNALRNAPRDLDKRVRDYLVKYPTVRWDQAVQEIARK